MQAYLSPDECNLEEFIQQVTRTITRQWAVTGGGSGKPSGRRRVYAVPRPPHFLSPAPDFPLHCAPR